MFNWTLNCSPDQSPGNKTLCSSWRPPVAWAWLARAPNILGVPLLGLLPLARVFLTVTNSKINTQAAVNIHLQSRLHMAVSNCLLAGL
jgi:hypothetical protein